MLALLATTACTSPTRVSSAWHTPESQRRPYDSVLVIGVSADSRRRRSFEEAVVAELTSTRTRGWSSVRQLGAKAPVDRETLLPLVRSLGAEAVLVTRLVSRKVLPTETEDRVEMQAQQSPPSELDSVENLYRLFTYDYHEHEEPGELQARSHVILDTELYDTDGSGRLVYSLTVDTTFTETEGAIIAQVSSRIVRRLREDGLLHSR
jgi:hypothetical protein